MLIPCKIHHPPHSLAHLLAKPGFTTDDSRAARSTRRRSPRNLDKSSPDKRNKESNSRMDRPGSRPPLAVGRVVRISCPENHPASPAKTPVALAPSPLSPDPPAGSSVASPAPK